MGPAIELGWIIYRSLHNQKHRILEHHIWSMHITRQLRAISAAGKIQDIRENINFRCYDRFYFIYGGFFAWSEQCVYRLSCEVLERSLSIVLLRSRIILRVLTTRSPVAIHMMPQAEWLKTTWCYIFVLVTSCTIIKPNTFEFFIMSCRRSGIVALSSSQIPHSRLWYVHKKQSQKLMPVMNHHTRLRVSASCEKWLELPSRLI